MDQTTFDKLERLAKLRTDGALSDTEYDAEKTKLLAGASTTTARPADPTPAVEAPIDEARLAPIWRERFRLIDVHGMPGTKAHNDAIGQAALWERVRLGSSPLAFLLGPFYYAYLGLWRPALSLTGATVAFTVILDTIGLPAWLDRAANFVPAVAFAWACIPLYYLRVRDGIHSWNPVIWLKAK